MKTTCIIALCASSLLLAACGGKSEEKAAEPAAAAETAAPAAATVPASAKFDLRNGTPTGITAVYSSHSSKDNWDETNLLKQESLAPDASAEIELPITDGDCMYDLRADREGAEPLVVKGINMCQANGQVVTITP